MPPRPSGVVLANRSEIISLLEKAREEFVFSAYGVYCERRGQVSEFYGGVSSYWPTQKPVGADFFFDMGSITKVVVTTTLCALALQAKKLSLDDPLGKHLPDYRGTGFEPICLRDLLAHCAGLEGWISLYQSLGSKSLTQWFKENEKKIILTSPRQKALYSDLGFLLLGQVIERIYGSLERSFQKYVAQPLQLHEISYRADPQKTVATEFCLWRKRLLQGEVFDENSAILGGETPHAGLFATPRSLAPWCRAWLLALRGESDWLHKNIAERFTQRSALVAESTWALGWDTKSVVGSGAGSQFSPKSFGHYGYPGCSVWVDPLLEGFVIFFTNRVHPSRIDERIRRVRPLLHDAIVEKWRKEELK